VKVSVHCAEHFEALHGTPHRKTAACGHKRKRGTGRCVQFNVTGKGKVAPVLN
jgi:hypothetical protein